MQASETRESRQLDGLEIEGAGSVFDQDDGVRLVELVHL